MPRWLSWPLALVAYLMFALPLAAWQAWCARRRLRAGGAPARIAIDPGMPHLRLERLSAGGEHHPRAW